MRKLKSSEKRKWVVNGLLAFGAVALLTTGFATWIVGVNQREANGGVNVQVDTAQKNNVSFTFEIGADNEIYVGEKTNSSDDNFVNITGDDAKDTDFTVGVKITIEVGAGVSDKPTKVSLAINYDGRGLKEGTDNTAASGNKITYTKEEAPKTHKNLIKEEQATFTYIDINESFASLTLPSVDGNGWTITNTNGDFKYEYVNDRAEMFKWGSYFGGKAPSVFYNELYKSGDLKNTSDDVNLVYGQLQAMKEVFMTKTTNEGPEEVWEPKTLNILATLE